MHEAGIARAIIAALHAQEPGWQRARVLVCGGYVARADFDAALRLHLGMAEPGLDQSRLEIVHRLRVLTCTTCGVRYETDDIGQPCPTCGGSAWPDYTPETIEVELLHDPDQAIA